MRVIVVADRAHREAARAVAERADHAQQPLPEAEEVARAERSAVLSSSGRSIIRSKNLQDLREAELLRLGRARALVDAPVQHRVGRARVQAAAARLADAHLLGDARVGLELELGEDAGEVQARAELGREDVDLEPERAEARLDAEVPRREPPVARALQRPLGLLRGGDEGRMAVALQLLGERDRRAGPSSAAPACRGTAPARSTCSGTRRPGCGSRRRSRSCSTARCAPASAASADRAGRR